MMSCVTRETILTLSTDLNKLADEIRISAPNYFFNVPTLLERVKRGVEKPSRTRLVHPVHLQKRPRRVAGAKRGPIRGGLWLFAAQKLIFSKIRERFGPNLRGLVCGSAPLAPETQDFFAMLGIPIWQVYGSRKRVAFAPWTTCAFPSEPGRVGQSVPGIEMKPARMKKSWLAARIFSPATGIVPKKPPASSENGWFHTGDQGE